MAKRGRFIANITGSLKKLYCGNCLVTTRVRTAWRPTPPVPRAPLPCRPTRGKPLRQASSAESPAGCHGPKLAPLSPQQADRPKVPLPFLACETAEGKTLHGALHDAGPVGNWPAKSRRSTRCPNRLADETTAGEFAVWVQSMAKVSASAPHVRIQTQPVPGQNQDARRRKTSGAKTDRTPTSAAKSTSHSCG